MLITKSVIQLALAYENLFLKIIIDEVLFG